MFGMSFMEIMIIAVIAVLFLGPDKLPSAMVQIAKFFKTFKTSINDAKASIEQEIKLEELKEETKKYKQQLEDAQTNVRKTITFDELNEIKKSTQSATDAFREIEQSVSKAKDIATNPLKAASEEITQSINPKEPKGDN
ncbi:MAG TPA: twin-arginine translocase subunit TatB [Sulfurospirillum sp. UBA12182]|jgi:sec-independent protein translocase protein TatB|nr:MAG TPA: twin-arginine translocase subunit TatB [Sulfurospirillum sp. UBA12182]